MKGERISAAPTSLMTGHAYRTSTRLADRLGPFEGFETNREPMLRVLDQHREAAELLDTARAPGVGEAGREAWLKPAPLLSALEYVIVKQQFLLYRNHWIVNGLRHNRY